jgi:hypothetical protein
LRLVAAVIALTALIVPVLADAPPNSVKTLRIQQPPAGETALYAIGSDGVVSIDWNVVETLASSQADRALSPVAQVMLAIRDRTWRPMR